MIVNGLKAMKETKNKSDLEYIIKELEHPITVASEGTNLLKEYFENHQDVRQRQIFHSIQNSLDRAVALLKGILEELKDPSAVKNQSLIHFDILHYIQQVCSTHDKLFLQRQLRYRVTASSDLPKVFANPDQVFVVLSNLASNAIKFAPRSSEIEIRAKEVPLRQGAGVEINIINESPNFTEKDRYQIFEKFYNTKNSEAGGVAGLGLAVCREIIQKSGGQLWVDIPAKGKVFFAFVLPCAEVTAPAKTKSNQTYKYDISISNYKDLKEKIGSEKLQNILHQIESSVRKLVRYPIDVVAAFESSGIISTIYETQEGFASSISTRISQKLGEEQFKIGKTSVSVTFKYHLSVLQ